MSFKLTDFITVSNTGVTTFGSDGVLINRTGADSYLFFQNSGTNRGAIYGGDPSGNAGLRFYIANNSDPSIVLTSVGNVGIGTTSPTNLSSQTSLTIQGASVSRLDLLGASGAGGGVVFGTATAFTVQGNYGIPLVLDAGDTADMNFNIGGSTKLTISSGGKITLYQPNSSNNDRSSYNIGGGNIDNVTGQFNTGFGKNNLTSILLGSQNIAIGANALSTNTDGDFNIAVGYNSLLSLTTGASNTAYGNQTLQANTYASQNSAFGTNALILNVSGASNTALGYLSLGANTSGPNNVAVGALALRNSTGTTNTAIGHSAGSAITTGDNNVIIGTNTGSTIATSDNNIIISDGDGNIRQFINGSGETFWGNSPKQAYVYVDTTNDIALIGSLGSGMDLGFITGTGTNKLTITSGGNVGIGVSPVGISSFTTLHIEGATGGGIKIGKTGQSQMNIQHDGSDGYINNTASGNLFFYTADSPRLTISSGGDATFSGDVTASNGKFYVVNTYGYYFGGSNNLTGFTGSNGTQTITAVTNGTPRLTISSGGNVGIGVTPSATTKVEVNIINSSNITAVPPLLTLKNVGAAHVAKFVLGDGTTSDTFITHTGGNSVADQKFGIGINATNKFVLDGNGNVGIGTSTLNSSSRLTLLESTGNGQTLEIIGANSGASGSQPGIKFTSNTAANIGGIYADTSSDNIHLQTGGTNRLTISSAGVTTLFANIGSAVDNAQLQIKADGSATVTGLMFINAANTNSFNDLAGIASYIESGDAKGNLQFWTRNSDGNNNDKTTRLTISSNGYVYIGADSGNSVNICFLGSFTGTGASFFEPQNNSRTSYFGRENASGNHVFATAITPYSTVIGAYNSTAPIVFGHNNAEVYIYNGGEVDMVGTLKSGGNQRFGGGPAHGNSTSPGITTKANGTAGVYWNSNGSGGWGGGTFTTTNSDRNMKTNIIPMDINALNVIGSLETKYFNWTEKSNRGDTTIRQAGIIAQDLKELMPEGVFGTEWDDEDEDTNGLSLNSNATTALFIKAIQEQQAQIEELKSEIQLLKNN